MFASEVLASPLTLIDRDEQAEEVLLLSYSVNLAFWERFALSRARGRGALVTLAGDPLVVDADPAGVRYSGVSYLDGRAVCKNGGAFHPKIVVITGDGYAHVAIGSGNVTVAGWHSNAELWTVLSASPEETPDTITEVSDWLARLHAHVDLSPLVDQALSRVSAGLRRFPATVPGPRLVHNLDGAIIDALPEGPVEELVIYAPFFDRQADAVGALAARLKPQTLRVLVQSDHTVADGALLAAVAARHGGELSPIRPEHGGRYYHGKLIAWRVGDTWSALTGSPNASTPALLRTTGNGGNCELGSSADLPSAALIPETEQALTPAAAAKMTWPPRDEAELAVVLLAAIGTDEGLRLTLGRAPVAPATLYAADADVWSPVAELPPESTDVVVPLALPAGSPTRVVDGDGRVSNTVFVLGQRALRRSMHHQGRVLADPDTIAIDIAGAEAFAQDLYDLLPWVPQHKQAATPSAGGDSAPQPKPVEHETWEQYLERCEAAIGERMLHFALPLPELVPAEQPDDARTEEQTDDEDDGVPPGEAEPPPPDLTRLAAHQRRRRQRWCEQLVNISPRLVLTGRLAALRLLRRQVAYGLWAHPTDWVPLIASATAALAEPPEPYPKERAAVASMAACGLAMVRGQVQRFGGYDPFRDTYNKTLAAVRDLLTDATERLVDHYAADLNADSALALPSVEIMDIATEAALADPIDSAIETLQDEFDQTATRDGSVITITSELSSRALQHATLRCVGLAQDGQPVAATASGDDHRVTCAWAEPYLVFVWEAPTNIHGAVYRLGHGVVPRYLAEHPDEELPKPNRWMKNDQVPPEAGAVLEAAGVPWPSP